jgi:hypothetical protein
MNFNGEQHHAWKLQCNILSFTIVLTKTVLIEFLRLLSVLYKCFNSEMRLIIQGMCRTP